MLWSLRLWLWFANSIHAAPYNYCAPHSPHDYCAPNSYSARRDWLCWCDV